MTAVTADVSWLAAIQAGSLLARDLWLFAVTPGMALAAAVDAAQVRAISGWRIAALASSEAALPPAAFLAALLATLEGAASAHKGEQLVVAHQRNLLFCDWLFLFPVSLVAPLQWVSHASVGAEEGCGASAGASAR